MVFSSRKSDFVAQNLIHFELAVHISGCACLIQAESFLSKKNFDWWCVCY